MNNIDIIVSRFNEDLKWTLEYPFNKFQYIVYNKGNQDIDIPNTSVPNVGRESDTYLRFIIDHYNDLPDKIIFCQGNPFDHCSNFIDLINQNHIEDLIYLAHYVTTDDDNGCPNHCGLNIKEILHSLNLENPGHFTFPTGAQYIVSKKLIQNKSLDWWKQCYDIHQTNHNSPWIYERIWPLIFNYKEQI
jgi:hypothetical protein